MQKLQTQPQLQTQLQSQLWSQPQLPSQLQLPLQVQGRIQEIMGKDHHFVFNVNSEGTLWPNLHYIYFYRRIGIDKKLPAMKLLLRYGAASTLNYKNSSDNDSTILHHAAGKGDLKAAGLFIKHGSDVNAIDSRGKTPLHYAIIALQRSREIEEWAKTQNDHGINDNDNDNDNHHYSDAAKASYNCKDDCSDTNCNNYPDISGSKYLKMITLLLKKGADSKLCVYRQKNNLMVALSLMYCYCNCHNIVALLQNKGLLGKRLTIKPQNNKTTKHHNNKTAE